MSSDKFLYSRKGGRFNAGTAWHRAPAAFTLCPSWASGLQCLTEKPCAHPLQSGPSLTLYSPVAQGVMGLLTMGTEQSLEEVEPAKAVRPAGETSGGP